MENNNTTINNTNTTINNNTTIPSALFSVTFYDGETELNMGTVQITPLLTFKAFQSIISQKLHISPHQITIYFQNHNPSSQFIHHYYSNHHRRRHPVTSKFDFSSICNNDSVISSFFWVVQKRSRRTRRRKNHHNINNLNNTHNLNNNGFVGFNNNNNNNNFSILRRGEILGVNDLDYRMSYLELQREKYLMSMNLNSIVYNDISFEGFFNGGQGYNCNFSDDGASYSSGSTSSVVGYCDICYRNGDSETFHSCKNDAVTKVFRSPAGPIARPKKFDFLG